MYSYDMSYVLNATRKKPTRLWLMDSTPFVDYSGYGVNGTASTTPAKGIALTAGAANSSILNKDCIATLPSQGFYQGEEYKPFTLAASIRTITNDGYAAQTYRENKCANPSFETNINGWYGATSAVVALSTARGMIGSRSLSVTTDGTQYMGGGYSPTVAKPNTSYTWSGYVYLPSAVPQISALIRFLKSDATTQIGPDGTVNTITPITGSWFRVSVTATTPAETAYVQPMIRIMAPHTGLTFFIDCALLEETDTLRPWFDGNQAGFEWSGTTHGSVSRTKLRASKHINIVPSPNIIGNSSTQQVYTASFPTTGGPMGGRYTRKTYTETTTMVPGVDINYTSINGYGYVMEGQYIKSAIWVRSSVPQNVRLSVQPLNAANPTTGAPGGQSGPDTAIPANTWVQLKYNKPLPMLNVASVVRLDVDTPNANVIQFNAGDTWDVAMATMVVTDEFSSSTIEAFDGNSTGAEWDTTADSTGSYMLTSKGEQQILGNQGQMDGLTINGTVVSFVTKYLTSGECRVSYDLQVPRAVDVVGIYGIDKNSLAIDGVIVGETEITEAQKADKFVPSNTNLYSGFTDSGQSIMINGATVWNRVLSGTEIAELSNASSRYVDTNDVPTMYGGRIIDITQPETMVFLRQVYDTEQEWRLGQLSTVSVKDDSLVPTFENDISNAGYWLGSFNLGTSGLTSIFGVNINWDGVGAVVEASLDGTTWETCYHGDNVSVAAGINPTDKNLLVRITFPGGIAADPSYVKSLTVTGIGPNSYTQVNDRTVTFTNPIDLNEDKFINKLQDDSGIHFSANSYVNVGALPAGTDSSLAPRTIEIWMKMSGLESIQARIIDGRISDSNKMTFGTNPDGSTIWANATTYIDGLPANTTPIKSIGNRWILVHLVGTSAQDQGFYINRFFSGGLSHPDLTIGRVVTYPTALSTAEIANIYKSYTARNIIRADDVSVLTITEPPASGQIYAHDWTILASG